MRKETAEIHFVFPLGTEKKKCPKTLRMIYSIIFFMSDILDSNRYPVTQFCTQNANTQGFYFRCCNLYIVLRLE